MNRIRTIPFWWRTRLSLLEKKRQIASYDAWFERFEFRQAIKKYEDQQKEEARRGF